MLHAKTLLQRLGKRQAELARSLGVSGALVAQLLNHDEWPKSLSRQQLEPLIRDFLSSSGASADELASAFDRVAVEPDRCSDPAPVSLDEANDKGVDMILVKKRLSEHAKEHFKIARDPFDADPSCPDDVFLTPKNREVLSDMESALLNGRFIAVIGESGSGKSTLRELVEERLLGRTVKIIKPYVQSMEDSDAAGIPMKAAHIAESIIRTLDPTAKPKRSAEGRNHQVHELLIAAGCPCAIVVEEAHALPIPTLRQFKRLRELKIGQRQLLGVLLIGQQELEDKLSPSKREVREVVQRCEQVRIEPLGRYVPDYLAHRFQRAGVIQSSQVFDTSAFDAIQAVLTDTVNTRARQGEKTYVHTTTTSTLYPLAVGNLAVRAMNVAADLGMEKVDGEAVRRAAK